VPPKMRDNPRKHELQVALSSAQTASGTIPDILKAASTAMTAKAWTGGTSDTFAAGLTDQQANATRGGTASVEEIQTAYDDCPAQIEDQR
jgi:hypothetical protein